MNHLLNLSDREVSMVGTFSAALWALGLGLIVLAMATDHGSGQLGLFFAGWGGVLTIRGFACAAVKTVAAKESNAFELGRDSVHSIH